MEQSKLFDLSNQVAIVTGSSRGLGRAFAVALAGQGAEVVITSRTLASLDDTAAAIRGMGGQVLPLELEVTDSASRKAMVEAVVKRFGRIDILVNNAGCNVRKPLVEMTEADWDKVVDTNLKSAMFVTQAVAPQMIDQCYGRVILMGSVTCEFGYPGMQPYCASRGGTKQLTKSLAAELGPHGITVNCIAPGWFKTAQNAVMYQDEQWVSMLCERIPLGRPGSISDDLAGPIIFLASPGAQYITGQTLLVDGGITTGMIRAMPKPVSSK